MPYFIDHFNAFEQMNAANKYKMVKLRIMSVFCTNKVLSVGHLEIVCCLTLVNFYTI